MYGTNTPLLPTPTNKQDALRKDSHYTFHDPPKSSVKRPGSWILTTLLFLLASTIVLFLHYYTSTPQIDANLLATKWIEVQSHPNDTDEYDAGATFAPLHIQKLWGMYSPYFSVEEYKYPPMDCRVNQVNIVRITSQIPSRLISKCLIFVQFIVATTRCSISSVRTYGTYKESRAQATSCEIIRG